VAALLPTATVLPALARTPTPVKFQDVIRILKSVRDPTPKDFAAAGADVGIALSELVGDPKADTDIRARAAVALGRFEGQRPRVVLATTTHSRDVPEPVRAAAMLGLARSGREAVVEDLKPFLKDPSPALRAGAARALGEAGGTRAREFLQACVDSETSIDVRAAIEEALKRMRGVP
jgi:HEAT repeat protein